MFVLTQLAKQFFQKKYRSPGEVQRRHSSVRPRAKQSQYHFVPPSILIEEFLGLHNPIIHQKPNLWQG